MFGRDPFISQLYDANQNPIVTFFFASLDQSRYKQTRMDGFIIDKTTTETTMKRSRLMCTWLAGLLLFAGCGSDDENTLTEPDNQTGQNTPSQETPAPDTTPKTPETPETPVQAPDHTADWLGPLSPEEALEYMKNTYDQGLVIVDVTPPEFKLESGFTGSLFIPYTELDTRFDEIPAEKPVILHCVRGRASAKAYPILEEHRKDIPVLSYIAGEPLFEEFNTWLSEQSQSD